MGDSVAAQEANREGLKAIEKQDFDRAEKAFRAALDADLMYAPAHNNLGLVLLHEGHAYEAAWEFQYAAKLQPHAVEPRNNLGLVMEKVGHLDEAISSYEEALKIDPNSVEAMGHLARAYIKSGKKPEELRTLLKRLSFQNPDGDWDRWARQQLLRFGESQDPVRP